MIELSEGFYMATKIVIGYIMVIVSYVYNQASDMTGGIIDRGFDAGLSIGLLIIGLIVVSWYHWKYQIHARDVIGQLIKKQDEKDARVETLAQDHSAKFESMLQDTVSTNKDLCNAVKLLTEKITNK